LYRFRLLLFQSVATKLGQKDALKVVQQKQCEVLDTSHLNNSVTNSCGFSLLAEQGCTNGGKYKAHQGVTAVTSG